MKAVIVAAGYGSRFLPATKTVPKELFPLIDKPALAFILEEFQAAGIEETLIITSRRKKALEDYLDREIELETVFAGLADGEKRAQFLAAIQPPKMQTCFVRQTEMKGTGHALRLARTFTGADPFIVAYPDDLIFADVSLSLQLRRAFETHGQSLVAVQEVDGDVSRYGVVDPAGAGNPCLAAGIVEKPAKGKAPSNLVCYGRYLFTADFYDELEVGWRAWQQKGRGEFYHVDAMNRLGAAGKLMAFRFEGMRLDVGEPAGYLEAVCRYALMRPDLSESARALFRRLSG